MHVPKRITMRQRDVLDTSGAETILNNSLLLLSGDLRLSVFNGFPLLE